MRIVSLFALLMAYTCATKVFYLYLLLSNDSIGNLMELDRYDRQLLSVLQEDGRISNQDLADRIGLSPSPCLRRVRALEEAGLIKGYRALVDAKMLGLSLMALIHISMDQHTPERFKNFEAQVSEIPEVMERIQRMKEVNLQAA